MNDKLNLLTALSKLDSARDMLRLAAEQLGSVAIAMEKASPTEVATAYWELRQSYEALDEYRKAVYAIEDKFDKFLVPGALEREGNDLIRVPSLGRSFYLTPKYSASILEGQKDRAFEWLRGNGLGAVITETVNAGTLAKSLRELVANQAKDAPDDIFKLTAYNTTGSSKYTPKSGV